MSSQSQQQSSSSSSTSLNFSDAVNQSVIDYVEAREISYNNKKKLMSPPKNETPIKKARKDTPYSYTPMKISPDSPHLSWSPTLARYSPATPDANPLPPSPPNQNVSPDLFSPPLNPQLPQLPHKNFVELPESFAIGYGNHYTPIKNKPGYVRMSLFEKAGPNEKRLRMNIRLRQQINNIHTSP